MSSLNIAFKEWAAVCRALGDGRQTLILRKGGIAEAGGVFRPEYPRFWLYPTQFHHPDDVPPPPGVVRLTHFVDVVDVRFVESLERVLTLAGLHVWDEDTVRKRFAYRTPGLYVLTVRAFAVPAIEVAETSAYAGCKSWVELAEALPTTGAVPVLDDETFARVRGDITARVGA